MKGQILNFSIRKGFQRATNFITRRIYQDSNRDPDKSILVVGSARSGTTWLANIIASQGNSRIMFEPFNPNLVHEYGRFNYFQYMRPDEVDRELFDYCQSVFTGSIRNAWIDRYVKNLHPQWRVIKSIRSTLMLKWLDNQYPEVPKLLIIRHPCAVVLSRMKLGWATDDDIHHFLIQPKLVKDFLEDKLEIIDKAQNDEEKHAIIWCITNYVPIQQFDGNKINIIKYENLVRSSYEEIQKIFKIIKFPVNSKTYIDINKPSFTSTHTSAILTGTNLSHSWQNELSVNQINNILGIVDKFELSEFV